MMHIAVTGRDHLGVALMGERLATTRDQRTTGDRGSLLDSPRGHGLRSFDGVTGATQSPTEANRRAGSVAGPAFVRDFAIGFSTAR